MYYPYLRGKQFDLLALKEALSRGLLSNKIQPVMNQYVIPLRLKM